MIPISDYHIRPRQAFRPYALWSIVGICALVFIYQMILGYDAGNLFVAHFGMTPGLVVGWEAPLNYPPPVITPYLTLLTAIFLHGDFWHILFNMLYLWVFGDNIEHSFGHWGFLLFYLVGGVVANLVHLAFSLSAGAFVPVIGASGAIAAVMGAYLALFPTARIRTLLWFIFIEVPAYMYLVFWFAMQFFGVFGGGQGVAWWAHIGGFAFGYIVGFIYLKIFRPYAPPPWKPMGNTFFKKRSATDDKEDGRINQDIWRR